jgi:hypothetical protein
MQMNKLQGFIKLSELAKEVSREARKLLGTLFGLQK